MPGYQTSLRVVNTRRGQAATVPSGFKLYASLCATCHMEDLSGQNRNPNHRSLPVRDLRQPRIYKYGATDQALFRTIRFGIPRTAMGSYEKSLSEQQTWDLVNFVKSRWTTPP